MNTDAEKAEYWRKELVESLRLIASPYEVQCSVLPDYVHLPDEILNALTPESFDALLRHNMITEVQLDELKKYDQCLECIQLPDDYEEMLIDMQFGDQFKQLRVDALGVLSMLGEEYKKPTVSAVYVRGS